MTLVGMASAHQQRALGTARLLGSAAVTTISAKSVNPIREVSEDANPGCGPVRADGGSVA